MPPKKKDEEPPQRPSSTPFLIKPQQQMRLQPKPQHKSQPKPLPKKQPKTQPKKQPKPQPKPKPQSKPASKPASKPEVPMYFAWQAIEDIEGLDKISKNASALLRLHRYRDIELNRDKDGKPRTITYSRTYNVESVLMQITGNEVEFSCERCTRKRGPYVRCVKPQGADSTTPCANCHYNSMGKRCSFVDNHDSSGDTDGGDGSDGTGSSDGDDSGEGSDDKVQTVENPQGQQPQQPPQVKMTKQQKTPAAPQKTAELQKPVKQQKTAVSQKKVASQVLLPQEPPSEELVQEEPVQEEPVQEEPVQEELVEEELVQEEPAQEEPAQDELVQDELVQEEPVQEEPVQEEPSSGLQALEESTLKPPATQKPAFGFHPPQKRKHDHLSPLSRNLYEEDDLLDADFEEERRRNSSTTFSRNFMQPSWGQRDTPTLSVHDVQRRTFARSHAAFSTPSLADEPAFALGRAPDPRVLTHPQFATGLAGMRTSASARTTFHRMQRREPAPSFAATARSTQAVPPSPTGSYGAAGLASAAFPAQAAHSDRDFLEPWFRPTGLSLDANRELARWHRTMADILDREFQQKCKEQQ